MRQWKLARTSVAVEASHLLANQKAKVKEKEEEEEPIKRVARFYFPLASDLGRLIVKEEKNWRRTTATS